MTGDRGQIQLLLSKHSGPPTPEGKNVPILAYAVAGNNSSLFGTLLACGTDSNTALPSRCDKDFLALLPSKGFSSYVEGDKGLTVLMLAAGLGREDYLRALLAAGANRNQLTKRDKCLHWTSPRRLVTGVPHKFFLVEGRLQTNCASKFLSPCNGSLSLKTACRYIARNVRRDGKVTRRRRANL